MSGLSPIPSYVVGGLCVAVGANVILRPNKASEDFGLPLDSPTNESTAKNPSTKLVVSPFILLKGIREISYGAALAGLQYTGQDTATTILTAVLSLVALGDGVVVWTYGGDRLRTKAFGHWGASVGFAAWSWWRFSKTFGVSP